MDKYIAGHMNSGDVFIEKVWSYPEWSAFFLEKCAVYVQIKNRRNRPISIEKVECIFQNDEGIEPFTPTITPRLTLENGHLSRPIRIEFEADLAFRAGTNSYRIVVYYRTDDLEIVEHDPRKFIIFSMMEPEESFFISHKDPEDSLVCRHLAYFLRKIGFIGYLSEDDRRPGMDLWREKIPEAIKSSIAVVVLWTSRSAMRPDNIFREIDLARSMGKRLIMACEEGVDIPDSFPKEIEYYRFQEQFLSFELKRLACSIEDTYRRGGYSKEI